MLNFVFLCPKRWLQLNSRIVRTHFSSIMILNNWKMIAETRSYIFRWRFRFRRRRVCLSSLILFTPSRTNLASVWPVFLSRPTRVSDSGRFSFPRCTRDTEPSFHPAVWYLVSFDTGDIGRLTSKPCAPSRGRGTFSAKTRSRLSIVVLFCWLLATGSPIRWVRVFVWNWVFGGRRRCHEASSLARRAYSTTCFVTLFQALPEPAPFLLQEIFSSSLQQISALSHFAQDLFRVLEATQRLRPDGNVVL